MLNVLHTIARLPGAGTERQMIGMLKAAQGRHWNPTVCVFYPGFSLADEIRNAGIPVIDLGSDPTHTHAIRAWRLRKILTSGEFDVVNSSLWGGNAFTRMVALTSRRRPALVATEHRVEEFRSLRRRMVDSVLSPWTDLFIGNSDDVKEFVIDSHRVPRDRVVVIKNGIDRSVFYPKEAIDIREPASHPLRIGAVGRLVEQKGFDVLIDAVKSASATQAIELQIVGDGPLKNELMSAAGGSPIEFKGYLGNQESVAEFMRSLDVFVMPSRYEGLPNSVLEALACGVDVIATDVPGMREATGEAARLVAADDAEALTVAIKESAAGVQAESKAAPYVQSFDDVAAAHLQAFERAVRTRG